MKEAFLWYVVLPVGIIMVVVPIVLFVTGVIPNVP